MDQGAVKDCLENTAAKGAQTDQSGDEPLMTRKEIAGVFRISLVTLHDWMKHGLPFHKQRGRVYFLRSEVLEYVKQKQKPSFFSDLQQTDTYHFLMTGPHCLIVKNQIVWQSLKGERLS